MPDLLQWYAPDRRTRSLVLAFTAIALIAIVDYFVKPAIGIGILYFFPLLVAASFLSSGSIVLLGVVCAILREAFGPTTHSLHQSLPRCGLYSLGFIGVGLIMRELVLSRQRAAEHLAQLKSEMELRDRETRLREEAERQLLALIESSPAAILTVDPVGAIEMANEAARRLLYTDGDLIGRNLDQYIPDAGVILNRLGPTSPLRTAMECRGKRENGDVFLGQLWMSHFETHAGPRMAVIISDASEQLRDREEIGLEQSLSHSRILVSAVSHEIRNLCSAIAISHANLGRIPEIDHNTDYQSLGKLVDGLRGLSSAELMPAARAALEGLPLNTIFDDLRIVLQHAAEEAETQLVIRSSRGSC
jgi:two-component system, LuxR family, sensor kinase FixL